LSGAFSGLGVLEDDVGWRVARLAFFLDLGVEIVGSILGFPVAANEVHFVLEGAVWADASAVDLLLLFGDESPAVRFTGVGHEAVKRMSGTRFKQDVLAREVGKIGVILFD
jgi:hypothetical protein